MRRFRVSGIQWDAPKKSTYRKIPKVIWIELPDETQDIRSLIEILLCSRFKLKPIALEYLEVTIDAADMDMEDIIRGMTPQD